MNACIAELSMNEIEMTPKTTESKNQRPSRWVQIMEKLRAWGPLFLLAVIVPGGSLLALLILRRQHAHDHGR
jgi:hypothetical protein